MAKQRRTFTQELKLEAACFVPTTLPVLVRK